MNTREKIKEALCSLQQIQGVEGCYIEEEAEDIIHVYAVTAAADYELDSCIFQDYARIEQQFPEVSFEFLITSQAPRLGTEEVFSSPTVFPAAQVAVS